MTVKRFWRGWTSNENAERYQTIFYQEVIPGIEAKKPKGFLGAELLRRDLEHETEFMSILVFESMQNIIDLLGENYLDCYVPEAAKQVLSSWDEKARHYQTTP